MSTGCSDVTPPVDPRCDDPIFREANPELCKYHPQLILAPSYALTEPGSNVTYIVLLRANGVETEITKGLEWTSSNLLAAEVSQEGVATGVQAGQTTISVTWQDLSAQAQLDVVGSCQETHQNFRIVIDHSKSMGQAFSSSYATKLSFSKSIAADFVNTINFSKDQVGVSQFADEYGDLQPWTTDADDARAAINSIALVQEKTDLAGALSAAIESFEGETGVRVIVLFTDGEWTGDDPKPIAQSFRESGGFLVIVATRSWGDFFTDLLQMASSGFLLSAYGATQSDILTSLSGLKSFLCSGSCSPEPGTAPHAQLNYEGFINWDVFQGRVDLVGLGIWDVLTDGADHGLYVDLQGTWSAPTDELGGISSKADFTFTAGEDYKFTIGVAGNWRGAFGAFVIRIRCGDELDEEITVEDPWEAMTPREFTWTPASTHTGKIIIEQLSRPAGVISNVGLLIDDITLENLTNAEALLFDDFNEENPTTIEPSPGYGYGCLETPPGSQSADPSPPTPRVVE
jgi:hypothetical protein